MHIAYGASVSSSGIKSRLSHAQWTLKPQDLAVAFKLVSLKGQRLPYAALAHALHLSPFEAHACIARLSAARLLTEVDGIKDRITESRLHGHLMQARFKGDQVPVKVLREGRTIELSLPMQ